MKKKLSPPRTLPVKNEPKYTYIIKRTVLFLLPLLIISLLVLWPSFNLHLTGDDYLGLWRYHYYLDGHTAGKWNNFSFFFTDYGPQDTMTAIIHSLVGFQPQYYYLVSYILRLIAGISFFPLVLFLTRNKRAAYIAAIFFTISTAGLETTDWSFNMPSYAAIALMNIFLLVYLYAKEKKSFRLTLLAGLLFYVTIIAQPIRMTFLPIFAVILELYTLIKDFHSEKIRYGIARIFMFCCIAIFVYLAGYVGNSVGAGETLNDRVHGGWLKVIGNNMAMIKPFVEKGQYQVFAYPIAQLGSVIFPTHLISQNYQVNTVGKALFKLAIPLFLLFALVIVLYQSNGVSLLLHKTGIRTKSEKKKNNKQSKHIGFISRLFPDRINAFTTIIPIILAGIWTIYSFLTFILYTEYLFTKSQFISLLVGGYLLIFLGLLFINNYKINRTASGIFLGSVLIVLSFITPWSRNPTFLFETIGRYLIVPAAGITVIIGMLIGCAKTLQTRIVTYLLVGCIFVLHVSGSFSYLYHLSTVRSIAMTQKIRESVPKVAHAENDTIPVMVYFEPKDSEVLHHALLFGFPVIMGFQYHYFNVWHVTYTDVWDEVLAAYKDGSSLKRFSIPVKRVKLEDIYSFRLDNDTLINTSEETRRRLKETIQTSK